MVETFAEVLIQNFQVSQDGTHIGVVVYSTDNEVVVNFKTLGGSELNAPNVNARISKIDYEKWEKKTYIDRAIHTTNRDIFTKANGMRDLKTVPRVRQHFLVSNYLIRNYYH